MQAFFIPDFCFATSHSCLSDNFASFVGTLVLRVIYDLVKSATWPIALLIQSRSASISLRSVTRQFDIRLYSHYFPEPILFHQRTPVPLWQIVRLRCFPGNTFFGQADTSRWLTKLRWVTEGKHLRRHLPQKAHLLFVIRPQVPAVTVLSKNGPWLQEQNMLKYLQSGDRSRLRLLKLLQFSVECGSQSTFTFSTPPAVVTKLRTLSRLVPQGIIVLAAIRGR